MADVLFPFNGLNITEKVTFYNRGSSALTMGVPVRLVSGSERGVQLATSGTNTIGWAMPDDSWEASSGAATYAAGKQLTVALKGPVLQHFAGTSVTEGDILTIRSGDGRLSGDSNPASNGLNAKEIVGIALQSGGSGAKIEFVQL